MAYKYCINDKQVFADIAYFRWVHYLMDTGQDTDHEFIELAFAAGVPYEIAEQQMEEIKVNHWVVNHGGIKEC